MQTPFVGSAVPLDQTSLSAASDLLSSGVAEIWAVLSVETGTCGFFSNRRPKILFERHIFSRLTNHAYDAQDPDISNPTPGGYGAVGAAQYDRLAKAMALNSVAAQQSASWGIGQIMGFNAVSAGFPDVATMVSAMCASEGKQLIASATWMKANNLDKTLRSHDWAGFARGYNGENYAQNRYDIKLSSAFQAFSMGSLPDLAVRSAQLLLTYLSVQHPSYNPVQVDGQWGKLTCSALNHFQADNGIPISNSIGDSDLTALSAAVNNLAP